MPACADCGTPVYPGSARCMPCHRTRTARRRTSAVYTITHMPSGRVYVGSSTNVESRWSAHQSKMRCGTHESELIRALAAQGGVDAFAFAILEEAEPGALKEREQVWMDSLGTAARGAGLNSDPDTRSPRGRKLSASSRARVGDAKRGKRLSEEHRAKISAKAMGNKRGVGKHYHGVLTEHDVSNILHHAADGASRQDLAERHGVSETTVGRIVARKIWWNVSIPAEVAERLPNYAQQYRERRQQGRAGMAKRLTEEAVRDIRARCAAGERRVAIAAEYGIAPCMVSAVHHRRAWKHVT